MNNDIMAQERAAEIRLARQEYLAQSRLSHCECPNCGEPLEHFSGLESIPEYDFCPGCMDWAYSDDGRRLFRLE